jgi:hypothetical protein
MRHGAVVACTRYGAPIPENRVDLGGFQAAERNQKVPLSAS